MHRDRGGIGQLLVGYGDDTGLDTGGAIAVGNGIALGDARFLEIIVIAHGVVVFVQPLQGQAGDSAAPISLTIREGDGLIDCLRGGIAAAVRFGGGRRNIRCVTTIGNASRIGIICIARKIRVF